jgi:hypothetical protein
MSTLRTNALEGVDAKNSITIVAGAGNVTTTNVEQGLAKQWCRIVQTSTQSVADSLNTASITDNGTGKTIYTFTNAMRAGTDYSILGTANQEGCGGEHSEMAAGQYEIRVQANDGSLADGSQVSTAIMGDLA